MSRLVRGYKVRRGSVVVKGIKVIYKITPPPIPMLELRTGNRPFMLMTSVRWTISRSALVKHAKQYLKEIKL